MIVEALLDWPLVLGSAQLLGSSVEIFRKFAILFSGHLRTN